jgi:alpha-soluble NSF attachment protein
MAEELMKKGEGKIGRILFNDPEGAYECFHKAAALFKSESNFTRAGDAFMRAGDLAVKLENTADACNNYTECAKMYARSDMTKAQAAIKMAVQINIDNSRIGNAARLLQNWGEQNEAQGNSDAALAAYERACELFFAEDQKSSMNQCKMRIATLLGMSKRWAEAAKKYEEIGMQYADGPTKTMAKGPFFNSFICRVAAVPAENRMEGSADLGEHLERIVNYDPYFKNTREHDAAQLLVEGMQEEDSEKIDEAIRMMDSFKMLDDLKTRALNSIKDSFENTN